MLEIWFFDKSRMIPGYTRLKALGRIAYSTLMARRFLIPRILSIYVVFILNQPRHLLTVPGDKYINTSSTTPFYWFTTGTTRKFAEGALLPYFQ
jgi:hypothetical protein